jgi:hypothetical protein
VKPLTFTLTLPAPILGIDLLAGVLGQTPDVVLEPLLREPARTLPNGQRIYPCQIPNGERLVLPLRQYGVIGFGADDGALVVFIPPVFAAALREQLVKRGTYGGENEERVNGSPAVAMWLDLRDGDHYAMTLGMLGAIGIAKG